MTLSISLDSSSTDATELACYAVDVCNHFSFLSIESTLVIESNVDVIPTANLCWKVMESSVSSLVGEVVTILTIWIVMFLIMELLVNLPWLHEDSFHLLMFRWSGYVWLPSGIIQFSGLSVC